MSRIGYSPRVKSSHEAYGNAVEQLSAGRLLSEEENDDTSTQQVEVEIPTHSVLGMWETMTLSLEFCILWVISVNTFN